VLIGGLGDGGVAGKQPRHASVITTTDLVRKDVVDDLLAR
jgi:hypothetical protein